MRIKWQDYDDLMSFNDVLAKIRGGRLTNVTVKFDDGGCERLHYELEADAPDEDIAKALGFRVPPS